MFNERSQMYDARVAEHPEHWYNDTELSPSGLPYAFEHHRVAGYRDGYPVLLQPFLSEKRAKQMANYLYDSDYLSATLSVSLTAQLATYNPTLGVIGYWRGVFTWNDEGTIGLKSVAQGLPAVPYNGLVRSGRQEVLQFVSDFFLFAAVVSYIALTASDVWHGIAHQPLIKAASRVAKQAFSYKLESRSNGEVLTLRHTVVMMR